MKRLAKLTPRRRNLVVALGLFLLSLISVMIAQADQGIARDEVVYMRAGKQYAAWWEDALTFSDGAWSKKAIDSHFGGRLGGGNNPEHPPFMKTLFGFSKRIFHDGLGVLSETSAYRMPSAMLNALLVVLVFLFTVHCWGFSQAVFAALLTLFLPRAFFHAGLACFDAAASAVWFAAIITFYRALRSYRWLPVAGFAYGIALATKHNAIILPSVFVTYGAWVFAKSWCDRRNEASSGSRVRDLLRYREPWTLVGVGIGGFIVLYLSWPWLWHAPLENIGTWLGFHFDHVHYNFEYLGRNWNHPPFPWHVALVTTLFTVPVATLVAGLCGAGVLVTRWRRGAHRLTGASPALLLFLSAGAAMGPFLLGSTPIFGAEKHWAAAIPTIAIFAGLGIVAVATRLFDLWAVGDVARDEPGASSGDSGGTPASPSTRRLRRGHVVWALGSLVVAASVAETVAAHPYGLSHYNALAGGAPGGADLGMNRQFWGYAARGVLPFLNRVAQLNPGRVPVYAHDADMSWSVYHREGLLDRRVYHSGREQSGIRKSKLAIVVHELHFNRHDYLIWEAYDTVKPVFVLTTDGVPIVSVYARKGVKLPPASHSTR